MATDMANVQMDYSSNMYRAPYIIMKVLHLMTNDFNSIADRTIVAIIIITAVAVK